MDEVHFYGHHISRDGLKADPSKIAAIADLKIPEWKNELQTQKICTKLSGCCRASKTACEEECSVSVEQNK